MMQLEDNGFKELRQKLHDVELPVDDQIWTSIQDTLRKRRMRRVFYWASSVAAVLLLALLVMWPSSGEQGVQPVVLAEVSEVGTADSQESVEVEAASVADIADVVAEVVSPAAEPQAVAQEETVEVVEAVADGAGEVAVEVATGVANVADVADAVKTVVADAAPVAKDYNREYEELWESEISKGNDVVVAFITGVIPGSSASAVNSSIRYSQSGVGSATQNDLVEQISDTKYSLPLNLGLQVQFPVKENLALGVGVNYTVVSSRYDCLINKKKYSVKQSLHYIGIPVNIYGKVVERNRFSFYVNAGATAEKGLTAVYKLESYTGNERNTNPIDGIQFSVNAGLGVEYKFANPAGIYFEPNMVYFFNSDVPRSIRTDQPLQVKGEIGIRFHF